MPDPLDSSSKTCLVIGAGLSGLIAAQTLSSAGWNVTVLEKESRVGGRLASLNLPETSQQKDLSATFDFGAQFFTVRDPFFQQIVDQWLAARIVVLWSRGFAAGDGAYNSDGHPRYRGHPDMPAIAAHLAIGLDVRLNRKVISIELKEGLWSVSQSGNLLLKASTLIVTPPVPQTLRLFNQALLPGLLSTDTAARYSLEKISYDQCLALLILLDGPIVFPHPGGLWPQDGPIDWIADNFQKEVSSIPGAFTIHAGAEFSRRFWDRDDELISAALLEAAAPWLTGQIIEKQVYRWPYSKPTWTYPHPHFAAEVGAPLIFAGDAFAGPRIEGAVLSGLSAAKYLLSNHPLTSESSEKSSPRVSKSSRRL